MPVFGATIGTSPRGSWASRAIQCAEQSAPSHGEDGADQVTVPPGGACLSNQEAYLAR